MHPTHYLFSLTIYQVHPCKHLQKRYTPTPHDIARMLILKILSVVVTIIYFDVLGLNKHV